MFPWIDGFHWTPIHIIFLTVFGLAVIAIVSTFAWGVWRTVKEFRGRSAMDTYWRGIFAELPEAERRCRHEFSGRVKSRICDNAFDCRSCQNYVSFAGLPAGVAPPSVGVNYSDKLLYHRGHTWVQLQDDGTYLVGLDEFANHLVGRPDVLELPQVGKELRVADIAWRMKKKGHEIGVRAPLDGTVVATGGETDDWYLKVRASEPVKLRHLLTAEEVPGWLAAEVDRLQMQLSAVNGVACLADGGALMPDLMDAQPEANWDAVLAGTFLDV